MSNVKNVNVNVCSNHVMRDDHHNVRGGAEKFCAWTFISRTVVIIINATISFLQSTLH